MIRFLPYLVELALLVFCVIDLIQTREDQLNRTYCVTSPEHREAVAAFKEKRPPQFEPRGPDPLPALG